MPETRRGTSTVPHGAADSSDMEASGGQGSPPNSQAEELGTTLEIEREKTLQAQILLQQMEVQLKMTELTAIRGARAGVGERDPGIERGEALKHYSKMLHGAIPKFPQEAEVPVWFETVECLFERYAVPREIQAHLVYPLIATRLAYLCAGMKDGEFTFAHLRSVVLAELRLSADEYRKRFSTAFKKRDETWKQFSTRLASYLQYYLEARDAKDFPKLTSLLVADRMKEAMGEDAREYVTLREGKEWLNPADIADLLAVYNAAKSAPRGQGAGEKRGAGAENRFHDGGRNDQKKPTGDGRPPARPSNAPLRSWRNCDMCGSPSHRAAECPRAREPGPSASGARVQNVELRETGSDRLTLRVSKVLEERPAPSALTRVHVMCGGKVIQALVDSGAEITVVRESLLPIEVGEPSGSVTLVSAFGQKVNAKLVTLPMWLLTELDAPTSQKVHETVSVICALTDDLAPHTDCLLALDAWEALSTSARRDTTPPGADTFGGAQSAGAVGLVKEADGATDSAESPTEQENACQAETPRDEPRAQDVGPALSGAGRRLELARAQGEDPTLAKAFRDARIAKGGMFVEDGLLYHQDRIAGNRVTQLVLPRERRGDVLLLAHESPWGGHLGTRKTMARIKYSFYWPAMEADVKRHCSSCPACQLRADRRTGDRVPISPLTRPEWPFQCVNMDVIGPLDPPSARGHRYALCVVDLHTRWPEVICLRSLTAKATCEALLEIFSRTGVPERICCDQGTNFTAGLTREFLARLGCTPRFSTPDHPESNGSVERWNRVFKNMLHHVIRDEAGQWDKFVPYLLWAYREVPHETTGASPFELLYGRTPTGPLSILRDSWTGQVEVPDTLREAPAAYLHSLREKMERAADTARLTANRQQRGYASYYNRRAKAKQFEVGERVVVFVSDPATKLHAKWSGPHTVVDRMRDHSYVVEMDEGKRTTVHANKLRAYRARADQIGVIYHEDDDFGEVGYTPRMHVGEKGHTGGFSGVPLEHLSPVEAGDVATLLNEFEDLFQEKPRIANVGAHSIVLKDGCGRKAPHRYRIPEALKGEVTKQVGELLDLGLIYPIESEFSHPVVCVSKKDGSVRMCVDFRNLNDVTRDDAFPMSLPQELVLRVGRANYITLIDLKRGYWQVPMAPESEHYTAFVTHEGQYAWRVMPFGLKNAAATFQRIMNTLLASHREYACAYLDDVAIFSESWREHLRHLRAVFCTLRTASLTIAPNKCQMALPSIAYLGHVIGSGKHAPDPTKVEAIQGLKRPVTKREVRSALGLCGYYRDYVPNYAEIARPLTELTAKRVPNTVPWDQRAEDAFEALKQALGGAAALSTPDPRRPYWLFTDASDFAVGACLAQKSDDGKEVPISFASYKFSPTQARWATIEKEAFAVVWALRRFDNWLFGAEVRVVSDHNPLSYLTSSTPNSAKLIRWALALQRYNLTLTHRKGRAHGNADALSRLQNNYWERSEEGECSTA